MLRKAAVPATTAKECQEENFKRFKKVVPGKNSENFVVLLPWKSFKSDSNRSVMLKSLKFVLPKEGLAVYEVANVVLK